MVGRILLVLALLLASGPVLAYRPGPYEICSRNGEYCAKLNPLGGGIVVFKAGDREAVLWSADGYADAAELADDGQHLVLSHGTIGHSVWFYAPVRGNVVPLDYHDFTLLEFYRRGHVFRRVGIRDIMTDAEIQTSRDGDFYRWGDYLGIDEDGLFGLRTATGREIRLDMTTGEIICKCAWRACRRPGTDAQVDSCETPYPPTGLMEGGPP